MKNIDDTKIYLASNLKHLRNINGKTQEDVAEACNKKNTAISNWEKGIREPDAIDLSVLSDFFNVSIDDLMLKDLRFSDANYNFDELDLLWSKHKENLTEDEKEMIKYMLEKTRKRIDNQENK